MVLIPEGQLYLLLFQSRVHLPKLVDDVDNPSIVIIECDEEGDSVIMGLPRCLPSRKGKHEDVVEIRRNISNVYI